VSWTITRLTCALLPLGLAFALLAAASAAPADNQWRVIARGTDAGDQVAVVAVAKRRAETFDVRVRVTGEPKTAQLHTVVTCSANGPFGVVILTRRQELTLTAPARRALRLPIPHPENCAVNAIGIAHSIRRRGEGDTVHVGSITVEIPAPCVVQANGRCI
jgi:hypothetical protein